MTRLLIEGWRGVNHSYALVNQCQILELLRLPGLQLSHRDMPLAMPHWTPQAHDPGFAAADAALIAALPAPPPGGDAFDAVYRICSPFRPGPDRAEAPLTLNFMVTEMGLSTKSFAPGAERSTGFTQGENLIVTPTHWSRERLLEWGYAAHKVRVVTHGVNSGTFHPLAAEERSACRANLGFDAGHCVFLNLGAAFWNKGLDVLLLAYATLRQRQPHARLVLKDQRGVYGVGIESTLAGLCQQHPQLFTAEVLGSISTVTANLSQAQLRLLYGVADAYVSPYRAEGFNLPVLEAIACGTPVLVTEGGATDDFCSPALALFIESQPGVLDSAAVQHLARYREPSLDATVAAMERVALGRGIARDAAFEHARQELVERLQWQRPARELMALLTQQPQNLQPERDALPMACAA